MNLKKSSKYIAAPAKIFTTLVILLFAVCILQAIITGIATLRDMPLKPTQTQDPLRRISRAGKLFLPDGTIHLAHKPEHSRIHQRYQQEQIYDANDKLLWQGIQNANPYEYLSWASAPINPFRDRQMQEMQQITPDFSRMLEIPVHSPQKTEQVWRYDPKADFFIGYNYSIPGDIVGYIGSTGFTESKSDATPFGKFKLFTAWVPDDYLNPTMLWQTNREIYQIDFEKKQVYPLFESPESDIEKFELLNWKHLTTQQTDLEIKYRPLLVCFTKDKKIHLIMQNTQQKITTNIPSDWADWFESNMMITATDTDIFLYRRASEAKAPPPLWKSQEALVQYWRQYNSKPHKNWVELYKIGDAGGLTLVNRFDWTRPATGITERKDFSEQIKGYVTKFSPPLYDLAWHFFAEKIWQRARHGSGMTQAYADIIQSFRPGNKAVNWILTIAMTAFALWHSWARRTSWPKLIFWLAVVAAFNLAGLLTYLALNHTAVIKCPVCGNHRGLARLDCVRCGTELPKPEQRELDLIFKT